jgi:hypothetical protein
MVCQIRETENHQSSEHSKKLNFIWMQILFKGYETLIQCQTRILALAHIRQTLKNTMLKLASVIAHFPYL